MPSSLDASIHTGKKTTQKTGQKADLLTDVHLSPESAAREEPPKEEQLEQEESKHVRIFTDGSCDTVSRRGGWGYLLIYGDHKKTASGFQADTTNNRMELTAAVEALSALKGACRVTLVTDSQYLKKAFTEGWLTSWQRNGWKTSSKQPVKNKDLWERLLALSAFHELSWRWTKGHVGQVENELVDKLALQARKSGGH